jgi:hypothetical protein
VDRSWRWWFVDELLLIGAGLDSRVCGSFWSAQLFHFGFRSVVSRQGVVDQAAILHFWAIRGLELEIQGVIVAVDRHIHAVLIIRDDLVREVRSRSGRDDQARLNRSFCFGDPPPTIGL